MRGAALAVLALIVLAAPARAQDTQLLTGEQELRHHRFDQAFDTFRKLRTAHPESVHAHLGYQEAARRIGKQDGLEKEYEALWRKDTSSPVVSYLYARLLAPAAAREVLTTPVRPTFHVKLELARILAGEGSTDVDAAFKAASESCPADARDLGLLAGVLEDADRTKDALAAWQRAQKVAPARLEVIVGLAECQRKLGAFDSALELLRVATDLDRDDPEVFYRLGLVRMARGEPKEAAQALERAVLITPRAIGPLLLLGEAFLVLERYDDAEKYLKRAYEQDPQRVDVLRRLAECYELAEKNDESLELYKELMRIAPLDASAHKTIGWIYVKKGKFDEAIAELRQASDMDPSDSTPLFLIGYTYDLMGRWGEAVDIYEKLVKVEPEHGWGWHNLGLDQALLGDESKALRNLKKATEIDPKNPHFHLNYGYALVDKKKYRDAIEEFEAVVKNDPGNAAGHKGIALSNYLQKRYGPAAEAYEKAIEADTADAELHLEVGIIYQENLKDDAKALEHFEQYLVKGGMDPVIQAWVDELKKKVK